MAGWGYPLTVTITKNAGAGRFAEFVNSNWPRCDGLTWHQGSRIPRRFSCDVPVGVTSGATKARFVQLKMSEMGRATDLSMSGRLSA
jgi:hypothetical protein